jgi:AAA family ATPase
MAEATTSGRPAAAPIGGLDDEIGRISAALRHLKIGSGRPASKPVNGILLWGPSGTGKTLLGKALADLLGVNKITFSACALFSKFYGETEENLRALFKEAKDKCPCLIFIDDLDSMCPQRGDQSKSDQERRVLSALVNIMDDINECRLAVTIVAATSRIDAIDGSLRRPGRLDMEVEIGVPIQRQRRAILGKFLSDHELPESDLASIAEATHGFVGADLQALVAEAVGDGEKTLSLGDFETALTTVRPSAMREVQIEVPKVRWKDI